MDGARRAVKHVLARTQPRAPGRGLTVLIYHRVGGGTRDELDLAVEDFHAQLAVLEGHDVTSLDDALDALEGGDDRPRVVLTFDDGFAEVHEHAWPALRARGWPFTVHLATAHVGGAMAWEGARATDPGRGLSWRQLDEMVGSGLCTVGNHTHTHAGPSRVTEEELERCTHAIQAALGVTTRHFAWPWGLAVPALEGAVRSRFRSAATGEVGRNLPGDDPHALRRVPVRRTDPLPFFHAKLAGDLQAERRYGGVIATARRLRVGA